MAPMKLNIVTPCRRTSDQKVLALKRGAITIVARAAMTPMVE